MSSGSDLLHAVAAVGFVLAVAAVGGLTAHALIAWLTGGDDE